MGTCTELRIGSTEAALLELRHRGVPRPDSWTYHPYSSTRIRGDGRSAGFGYATATWVWGIMEQWQVDKLLDFFATASDASVSLFISTYTDTGKRQQATDFEAVMHRPVDGSGKSMIAETSRPIYQNVTVSFSHLEAT